MLQVARLAPKQLGESTELVAEFLRGRLCPEGGFADRSGNADLYYTVFGLEGLIALRLDVPHSPVRTYLESFGNGAELDFVHLACLARSWASMPAEMRTSIPVDAMLAHVESYRSADGGYAAQPHEADGNLYSCFLALGTYQDLGSSLPNPEGVLRCVGRLRAEDGGYSNQHDVPLGLTPATAAAVTLIRQLGEKPPEGIGEWLMERRRPEGGFFAVPFAPVPDLLSTATALHALSGLHVSIDSIREPCLDFIDTLWSSRGAFHGTWSDDILDCEYTYYALLALGHLSV